MKKVFFLLLYLTQFCFVGAQPSFPGYRRPRAKGEDQLKQPLTRLKLSSHKKSVEKGLRKKQPTKPAIGFVFLAFPRKIITH